MVKFIRKIGQVTGKSLYEVHDGNFHVGYITKRKNGWMVDVETPDRKQRIRNFVYLAIAKEYVNEIRLFPRLSDVKY